MAARVAADAAKDEIVTARRDEADGLFAGQVTAHEDLYRHALTNLFWKRASTPGMARRSYNPAWYGRVDARDVLIMPDKWEFPWLASWDLGLPRGDGVAGRSGGGRGPAALHALRPLATAGRPHSLRRVGDGRRVPAGARVGGRRIFERSPDDQFLRRRLPRPAGELRPLVDDQAGRPAGLFTAGFLGMDNLPRGARRRPRPTRPHGWRSSPATGAIASGLDDRPRRALRDRSRHIPTRSTTPVGRGDPASTST